MSATSLLPRLTRLRSRVVASANRRRYRRMQRRLRFFEQLEPRRMLASLVYNVDDTSDTFNGSTSVFLAFTPKPLDDGKLSLREAIYLANQAAAGDDVTINLASNATYNLSRTPIDSSFGVFQDYLVGDLDIRHQVKINGNGAKIDAKGISRVLEIRGSFPVELNNLTITGGRAAGSERTVGGGGVAVFGGANVTLQGVTVVDNRVSFGAARNDTNGAGAFGGGMYIDNAGGTITINTSTFSNNQALGQAGGGADDNDDGGDGGEAWGGGIFVHLGSIVVSGSTFTGNKAVGGAGGEADDDPATGGDGGASRGGAIAVGNGSLTVTNSTFRDNRAGVGATTGGRSPDVGGRGGSASGGAILLTDLATANISGSTFTKNIANASTGGFGDNGGGGGGIASGGAIESGKNTLNVTNTTFTENAALGGLGGRSHGDGGSGGTSRGGAVFTRSGGMWSGDTFTRNRAVGGHGNRSLGEGSGGQGGDATGGGIYIEAPQQSPVSGTRTPIQLTLTNPVFTGNEANAGNGDLGDDGVGGHGGFAAGGAISSNFPVTLVVNVNTDGPHFSENIARGGSGGNSHRAKMGDGGAACGGAIYSPGAALTLTGLTDKPLSFIGNSAIAGSAASASYAEPSDGATPGRGGDASGGAIYASAGLTADFVGLSANIAMSGRGTDGMASTTLSGTFRINDPDKGPEVKNPAVTTLGLAAGDSGRAQGGAMWANGPVDITVGVFLDNRAYGGRADSNTTYVGGRGGQDGDGRGLTGGRGGDAQGGALFTSGGNLALDKSFFGGNQAAAGLGGAGGSSLLTQDRVEGSTLFVVPTGQAGGRGGRGGDASGGALHAVVNGTAQVTQTVFRLNQSIAGRGGAGGAGAIGGADAEAHGGAAGSGGEAQGGSVALVGGSVGSATMTDVIIDRSTVVGGDGGLGAPGGTNGNGGRGGDGGAATGGGLVIAGPTVNLVTSTVSENVTSAGWGSSGGNGGFGGQAGGNGGNGGNAGQSRGGGVGVISGQLNLDRSTVFGNLALAGYGGQGGNGGNSNLLGGRGGNSGSGGASLGGGIWIGYNATPGTIHASTIVSNGTEAGGFGFVGEGGKVPRANGQFPAKRATSADPNLNLAFGSAAVLAAGDRQARSSVIGVPESAELSVVTDTVTGGAIGGAALGAVIGVHVGIAALLVPSGSIAAGAASIFSEGAVTQLVALTVAGTGSTVFLGAALVAVPVIVIGAIVIASFVLGDGDFVDGLEQVANRFTLDAADQPKYSLGILFSAGEREDPDEVPVPTDGQAGSKGTAGKAEGTNFFAVQFDTNFPPQLPHFDSRATFDRTILAEGKAVTRERIRHLPDVRTSIDFGSQPYLMREVVHVIENPADLAGAPVASNGHNFVGVAAGGFTGTGDQRGTTANPLDLKSVGFLQYETDAKTPTLRLQPDSPARDAGPVLTSDETSQNGFVWQVGTRPEIGAWGAGENRAPVADDFTISIQQGAPIEIKLSDLLSKTSDPDGDLRRLSFIDTTLESNGILNLSVGSTDRRLDTLAGQVVIPSTVTSVDLSGTGNVPVFDGVARIPLFAGDAATASADPRVISFTPKPDFVGVAEFPYRFTDGVLESNTGVLRIEVGDVNSAPSFTAGNVHVDKDSGPQTIANWVTAFAPGGPEETAQQPLAYNITAIGDASLFAVPPAVSPDGTLTFTPAAGVEGETTITVTVQDNGGTSNGGIDISLPLVFSIRIGNPNRQPSFIASSLPAINEDTGTQTRVGWASFNPGDARESQQLPTYLISNVSNPALFSAAPTVAADGTLTYAPAPDANGSSTFTVRVQDDGGTAFGGVDTSAPQTFTVTVNPVNDAPTFTASFADNQTATVVLNPLQGCCVHQEFPGFVSAFSPGPANEAGQSLVRYNVQRLDSLLNQSVSIDNSGKLSANLTYVLGGVSFEGAVKFRVTAEDNGGTANGGVNSSTSQIYTILVTRFGGLNAPPSVTAPALTVRPEDAGPVSVPGWAQFHQGVDGFANGAVSRYIVSNVSNPSLFAAPPAVANNGTLTFTSALNAYGTATFDLQVQDNGGTQNGGVDTSGAKQFTITVTPQNDRPSFTAPAVTEVNEDAGLVVIPNWVTGFDPGPNESHQQVRNYVAVSESFTIHEASFALFAEAPKINNDGSLSFRVKPNVFGDLHFKAAVVDNGGPGFFPDPININQSNFQSFIVRVLPVNDAPRYVGPAELTLAETAVPQRFERFATAHPGQDNEAGQAVAEYRVTANDNEALFAELPKIDIAGTLTFTLQPNAFGTANLQVIARDNGGTEDGGVDASAPVTITIKVTEVDDTPIVGQILAPASVRDKMLVPLSIMANTRTGDVSQLTYEWTITPPVGDPVQRSGKEIEVTFEEPGPHQVQTRVSNPQGDQVTRTVTLDVLPSTPTINALTIPTLALLGQEVVLRAAASDPVSSAEAVVLNWSVTNLVSGNTQTFAGAEFRFAAAAGGYDVELTATTAVGGTASRMQRIRVLAVETPTTGTEDEPSSLRVTDTNPNNLADDLSVLWTVTPSGGDEVELLGSPADYVPFDGGEVVVTATIGAPSGSLLNIDARTITVAAVNDAPMLNPIGAQSTPEGQLLTFTATATDIDSTKLTFSLDAGAPAGASIDSVTGLFTWTPTEAQGPGTFDVTIRVTDDGTPSLSHAEKIAITVAEMNQAPVLAAIGNKVVDEGSLLTFTANASDADDPANTLTYSLSAGSPAGAKIDPVTGVFTWTPTATQGPGTFEVTVRVSDDGAPNLFSESTFAIQVNDLAPWTNLADPLDATADGFISPLDVLVIINDLNDVGPRQLVGAPSALQFFLDVNKDGFVTPVDALIVINRLNEPPASLEGEYSRPHVSANDSVLGALVTTLAPAGSAVSTNSRTAAIDELLHESNRCLDLSDLELSLGLMGEDIATVLLRRTRLPCSA